MQQIRTTLFLPQKIHRFLKELAHKNRTSMAKLIQAAVEKMYLSPHAPTAKDLWGSVENTEISEKEFESLKNSLNPRL